LGEREDILKELTFKYAENIARKYADIDLNNERLYSGVFALRFLEAMFLPFEEWTAYRHGLIDENGEELKKPRTKQEKSAWNYFWKLMAKFKKGVEKKITPSRMEYIKKRLMYVRENESERLEDDIATFFYMAEDVAETGDLYLIESLNVLTRLECPFDTKAKFKGWLVEKK